MTERTIVPPQDVDSIGKLNEWLETCGMPQTATKFVAPKFAISHDPDKALPVEWEEWGFGFTFTPGNRDEASKGYRGLIKYVSGALYARFSDPRYTWAIWRLRPELRETAMLTKKVMADGSEIDWEKYDEFDDDRPEFTEVETGKSGGFIYLRIGFSSETP